MTSDNITPLHFATATHARIFEFIRKLVDLGQIASPVTLMAIFDGDPDLLSKGGVHYLAELAAAGPSLPHIEDHARHLYDLSQRRQLIEIAESIRRSAYTIELNDPPSAQIERAGSRLYQVAQSSGTGSTRSARSASCGARMRSRNLLAKAADGLRRVVKTRANSDG